MSPLRIACLATFTVALLVPLSPSALADEIKLTDSTGELLGGFGRALALSGDLLVVGSPGKDRPFVNKLDLGAVHVFRWDGVNWADEQELGMLGGWEYDWFGSAVAVDGDVIVVGAPGDDVGSNYNEGSAVVFRWNGSQYAQEQQLNSTEGAPFDEFGTSVSVDDDVIVVGAIQANNGPNPTQGSATVFRWNGTVWAEEQELFPSIGGFYDQFGYSVLVDGDEIFVGANADDVGGIANLGMVTVFRWDGSSWNEVQQLVNSQGSTDDRLGASLAKSGDLLVSGATHDDDGGFFNAGSAMTFRWDGTSWQEEQCLVSSMPSEDRGFGWSVAASGDTIVIGSPKVYGSADPQSTQAATVFRWDGSSWAEDMVLSKKNKTNLDYYGYGVAVEGERVCVGAGKFGAGATNDWGAVFVYDLSTFTWRDRGFPLGGLFGYPALEGSGALTAGSSNSVELRWAAALKPAALFLSATSLPVAFKGGVLKAFPLLLPPVFLATDFAGELLIPFTWPAGIPAGIDIWMQFGVQDVAAVNGVSLSNALTGTTL